MNPVQLHLSEELQNFIAGQVESSHFEGPAAYIEALIQRAKRGKEGLETLLIEGLDSGEPITLDPAEWTRIRTEVAQRLNSEK